MLRRNQITHSRVIGHLSAEDCSCSDEELNDPNMTAMGKKNQTTFWIYLYRCSKLGPRSLWGKQPDHVMEEITRAICEKAIRHRMSKSDIDHTPIKSPKLYETPDETTMDSVNNMIDLIISSHPELYKEITFKLNIPIQDERTVCRIYSDFAENLFLKGVSWPLIISFLAFSGSLAAECTNNGRSILVRRICDWCTLFLVMRLKQWLSDNGGWDGLRLFLNTRKKTSTSNFKSDNKLQLNIVHKHLYSLSFDKWVRLFLMGVIFLFLVIISYSKTSECQNKTGKMSKYSIYREC